MVSLKSFDFFRKIQTEQELTSTTGGIFTIASLIVATILIFLSIQDFTDDTYRTFLAVKNDPNEYIPMSIDITFNKAPCQILQLQFHDELEFIENNIQQQLDMSIIDGEEESEYKRNEEDRAAEKKGAEEGIEKGRGCRIKGTFNVAKTPGTLTFKLSGNRNLFFELDRTKQEKIRASYRLDKLDFGMSDNRFEFPISHSSYKIKEYIEKLEGDVFTRKIVQDFTAVKEKKNFYNHIKIIPIFVDDGTYVNEGDKQKYRFSLRAGSAFPNEIVPKLQFSTELEPINIVYQKKQMSVYELSINILAIVGGSVATIGVLNSISHFIFGIK